MLVWLASLMIIVFLAVCVIFIGASCYQIVKVIRRTLGQTHKTTRIIVN